MTTAVLDQEVGEEIDEEYRRQLQLEAERAEDEKREGEQTKRVIGRLMRLRRRIPHIDFVEGALISMVAVAADLIDYLAVGLIPVIGDMADVAVWLLIAMWVWSRGIKRPSAALMSGVIELIPILGDLVPTWTFMVLAIIIYNNYVRRKGEKKLKEVISKLRIRGRQ